MTASTQAHSPWPQASSEDWDQSQLRLRRPDGVELNLLRLQAHRAGGTRVLVFLHGIGSYGVPYTTLASALTNEFAAIFLPDLRGHGRSGGTRGDLGSASVVLGDVEAVVDLARAAYPDKSVVLGGHSMGGLIALAAGASGRTRIDALLLIAPALGLTLNPLHWLRLWFRYVRARFRGQRVSVHEPVPGEPIRDPEFVGRCKADPLMVKYVRLRQTVTLLILGLGWRVRYSGRIACPTLIVHGAVDRVVSLSSVHRLHSVLARSRLVQVKDAWHNVLWDPSADKTLCTIAQWFHNQTPRDTSLEASRTHAWDWWLDWQLEHLGPLPLKRFGVACLLILFPKLVLCRLQGTLVAPMLLSDWANDARTMGLAAVYRALSFFASRLVDARVIHVWLHWLVGGSAYAGTLTTRGIAGIAFPYLRDYADIGLMLLAAAYIVQQGYHWRLISNAPEALWAAGLIDHGGLRRSQFENILERYGRAICAVGDIWWSILLSTAIVGSFYVFVALNGFYGSLWPGGAAIGPFAWQRLALDGWWAHPHIAGWAGITLQLSVSGFLVYRILRGNFIGSHAVKLLQEVLTVRTQSGAKVLLLQPCHPDGAAGLGPVKSIFRHAIASTAILLAMFWLLLLYVPTGCLPLVGPLVVLFPFMPALLWHPLQRVNRLLDEERSERILELTAAIRLEEVAVRTAAIGGGAAACTLASARCATLERQRAEYFAMPTRLYTAQNVVIATIAYAIPTILFFRELIGR